MESFYLPYERYRKAGCHADYDVEHSYDRQGLARLPSIINHEGEHYFCNGEVFGCILENRKDVMHLIPRSHYQGEVFDRPVREYARLYGSVDGCVTMPSGSVRKRGDDTGTCYRHGGEEYVVIGHKHCKPLFPTNTDHLTVEDCLNYHQKQANYGWRAHLTVGEPVPIEYEGVVVLAYERDNGGQILVAHAEDKTGLFNVWLDALEDIDYLRDLEQSMGLRKQSTSEIQLGFF